MIARAARALAVVLLALVFVPAGARAASPFKPCYKGAPVDCAIVKVPIDRAGRVPGTVGLRVLRVKARRPPPPGRPRNAVIGLAGGPGQSAIPLVEDFYATISPALATRDLIVFDQRGTGLSDVLRCRRLERRPIGDRHKAVQDCATGLGPARAFFRTADSADDIEAVRRAAGATKVVPYGTSYGTKVALSYAQRYPLQTEALVLDSLVDLDGPDPFYRDSFGAIPRVLRELCDKAACAGITADPVGDLGMLVKRLETQSLSGLVVGGDGKRRARRFGRTAMFSILLEGDFNPALRADFPAAVRSALAGDAAPMLRLANRAQVNEYFPDPVLEFSPGLYTTTTCEEGPLPWDPALPFGDRWQHVFAEAATIPETLFAPFDRAFARANDTLRLCAPWPASGLLGPPDGAPLPDVPTLVLGGAADLRTPVENAPALVARLPHASAVTVPNVGHAVLDNDLSGCADDATRAFFGGKPVSPVCSRTSRDIQDVVEILFPPTPVPPRSAHVLGYPRRLPGRRGRTVRAVELTFFDAIFSVLGSAFTTSRKVTRIGGLRNGRLVARYRPHEKLRLDRFSYVPGVAVSSPLGDLVRFRYRLRVGGSRAAHGHVVLDLRRDLISGRLGGRRFRLRLSTDIRAAVGGLDELRRAGRAGGGGLGRCCWSSQVLRRR